AEAVRSHYDVSNSFYRTWLGSTMMYSSGMWLDAEKRADLDCAQRRKIDFFAARVLPGSGPRRVLDIGCGWGGTLRALAENHQTVGAGLTLSRNQLAHLTEHPIPGSEIRLEDWNDHHPDQPYDAI